MPLLRIEPIADAELGASPWAAVVFTSANAVRAVAAHRRFGELAGLPAYTVGRRTQAAATAAGFAVVMSADGDVDALVRLIASTPPVSLPGVKEGLLTALPQLHLPPMTLPLLYCAGEDRAGDLESALHAHGMRVKTTLVYRAVMVTELRPDVRAALASRAIDAILHYSARTAAAFVAAATMAGIRDLSIQTRHLCLSTQAAAPLVAAGARVVEVAREPTEQVLLALIGQA